MNGSISMNLGSLYTQTTVSFSEELKTDTLIVNGSKYQGDMLARVTRFLNIIRRMAEDFRFAAVESYEQFFNGSRNCIFGRLRSLRLLWQEVRLRVWNFSEAEYSRLARKGSGSACRSIPGGFCEWLMGEDDESSIAVSIAPCRSLAADRFDCGCLRQP